MIIVATRPTQRVPADAAGIARAAAILRAGGLVAFPTETVYGLGADALQPGAVAAIFAAKGRPQFDPLIVHTATADAARRLWSVIPPAAESLMAKFWPGPLTLALPRRPVVPDIVTAGLPTVAVRVPDHPVAAELLAAAGVPVAAPSANRFGRTSPTDAAAVEAELNGAIDLILDAGPSRVGVESTVLGWPDGPAAPPVLMRHGGVPQEAIEAVIGPVAVWSRSRSDVACPEAGSASAGSASAGSANAEELSEGLPSPGMLERHYAPRTAMVLLTMTPLPYNLRPPPRRTVGLVCLQRPSWADNFEAVEELSPEGNLTEGAARLFAAIRRLDSLGLDAIVGIPVLETGLGRAINDRLRRASVGEAVCFDTQLMDLPTASPTKDQATG